MACANFPVSIQRRADSYRGLKKASLASLSKISQTMTKENFR